MGIVVVDPHAAHEKIIYTRLLAAAGEAAGAGSQLLLIPVVIDCTPAKLLDAEHNGALLAGLGFAIEPFGPATLRCTAVPSAAGNADVDRMVGDVLDGIDDHGPIEERRHRLAALVACHSAVRFGDALAEVEQQRLLDDLATTPEALTCPHGRPTVLMLDDASLRRLFRRPAQQ